MWDYRKLTVWQRAVDLVPVIAELTRGSPDYEKYEIGRQMRRAVASIGYNIAEGSGKRTSKDYVSFLHIACGSANEVEAQVESVYRLGYLDKGEMDELVKELVEIKKMINGVIRFVREKNVR